MHIRLATVSTFSEFVIFKENEFKFVSVRHMVLTIVGGLNMERLMVLSTSFFSGFLCIGNCPTPGEDIPGTAGHRTHSDH